MMRCLTLHRPWDWAMAHGGKDIENRSWKPHDAVMGQRIALHAGQRYDYDGATFIKATLERNEALPLTHPGMIVATTRVIGWIHRDGHRLDGSVACAVVKASPWFFGPYGWVCRETIALPKPVHCRGAQGLWALPPEIEAAVLQQEQLGRSVTA